MSQNQSQVFRVDVRKLPPTLLDSEFQSTIKEYLNQIVYHYFMPGVVNDKETIFSRAHLNFKDKESGMNFINNFTQKFVDKQQNIVYQPVVCKSLYQVHPENKDQSKTDTDFRSGYMYTQFKSYQEQQQKLNEQKVDLSQIERKANEDLNDEKAKKFEKVQTPIIVSIEQKKKEERMKKMKDKINSGSNQIWVPKKNA